MPDLKARIGVPFQVSWETNPKSKIEIIVSADIDGKGTGPFKFNGGKGSMTVTPTTAGTFTYTIQTTTPAKKKDDPDVVETKTKDVEIVALGQLRGWAGNASLTPAELTTLKSNRDHVTPRPGFRASGSGLSNNGSSPFRASTLPPAGQAVTDQDDKIALAVKEEIGGEGGVSAVLTGDAALFTWGQGLAHPVNLEQWVKKAFAADPAIRDELLDYGITFDGSVWKIVDGSSGDVKSDKDALMLLQTDQQLLTVFIEMAESPKHGQTIADAQWEVTKANFIKPVPAWARAWSDMMMIRYCVHATMWGMNTKWDDFKTSKGVPADVLRAEVDVARRNAPGYLEKFGKGTLVKASAGKAWPAATMLHGLGAGVMIKTGVVTAVSTADGDKAKADDTVTVNEIYFDHTTCGNCITKGYFKLA